MNITKKVVDDVNIILSLEIVKADYNDAVEKAIKDARKNMQMPGFRKGMVPASLVRKRFGTEIKVDEVNKLINKGLMDYINENKVNVLGEPMVDDSQERVDLATADDFTISFAIAVAPEFTLTLDNSVKVPYYTIKVDDKMVENQVEGFRTQFGETVNAEEASADDVIKGDIAELDLEGNIVEGGIVAENATVYPRYFTSDEEKAKFNGAKKFASVDFNPAAATNNNANEMASMLQIDKEKAAGLTANFRFTITEISHREKAAMEEKFFTQVFGEECKTQEDFDAKIKEMIANQLRDNSEFRFTMDARTVLMEQVGELKFPEEFLKKWLLTKDEKRDAEKLEKDFPQMMKDLTWQLIQEKIATANEVKVTEEDIQAEAKAMVKAQMAQYGMGNLPEEYLAQYVQSIIKDEKQRGQLRDSAVNRKIMGVVRSTVALDEKEVSFEEFNALFA